LRRRASFFNVIRRSPRNGARKFDIVRRSDAPHRMPALERGTVQYN
jgi:hypothetical protein